MESTKINNGINAIKEVRKLFNELRSNLSREEINKIRKKLHRTEAVYSVLKVREQKGSLTSRQNNMLRNDERYLENISKHLKNLKKHFKKYQYGLDYLFNEPTTSNNDINSFKDARKLFNERRSNLLIKETNGIRKKLHKKEAVSNFLKEKASLTNKQKIVLKNISKYLKKLNNDLKKLYKYQDNITYGIDYLFNELNEEDSYEPKEIKSAFDGSYMLYESRGDKDNKLALYKYFDIIRPYLKDMINYYKSKGEWKIQLSMRMIFVSFIDKNETCDMYTKSDNITIMSGIETSDVINKLFNTFRRRYQEGFKQK